MDSFQFFGDRNIGIAYSYYTYPALLSFSEKIARFSILQFQMIKILLLVEMSTDTV